MTVSLDTERRNSWQGQFPSVGGESRRARSPNSRPAATKTLPLELCAHDHCSRSLYAEE